MRYGLIGETALERALLASDLIPTAMVEGYGPAYARAVVLAAELGIVRCAQRGASDCPDHHIVLRNRCAGHREAPEPAGDHAVSQVARRHLSAEAPRQTVAPHG